MSTSLIIPGKTPGRIIAVGRWGDAMTKGEDLFAGVVENSFRRMDGLEFVIVGKRGEYVSKRLPSEQSVGDCLALPGRVGGRSDCSALGRSAGGSGCPKIGKPLSVCGGGLCGDPVWGILSADYSTIELGGEWRG